MASHPESLTTVDVLAAVTPLLARWAQEESAAPRCPWCHGPAVWTTGNKARCTVCGYVPS
jgi:hypothetical protein